MIALERRGVICTLDPELGGSLLSLSVNGLDLLRPAPVKARDVLETACFPLVPFANRISQGRMRLNGREIVLPADLAAPPHAHHGHGWRRAWAVIERTDNAAALELRHSPDAWPWAYVATQRITLIDGGAEIDLSVTNSSDENMPAGLGLHPYFVRHAESTIETGAHRMVVNGSDGIPVGEAAIDRGEKPLAALEGFDNFLPDGSGRARLHSGGLRCDMTAQGAAGFHLYVPEHENFFCLEPVSHRPNAFARNAEQHEITPRETRRLIMRLTIASRAGESAPL